MAHLLVVSHGMPSVLYVSIELARRLAIDGHRVTFAGLPTARALVEHQGLEFLPLEASRYDEFLKADAQASILSRLLNRKRRQKQAREALALEDFARDLRNLSPDMVLLNGEMHEHIFVAASSEIPVVLLNSFVSIWRRRGLPPPHHLVRPGIGWKGTRIGMWLLWTLLRLRKWRTATSLRIRRLGCDRLSILRRLAQELGFDFHRETDAGQWLIPFTYRRFPVLSLHALEFEFPHRPAEEVHYVGPMVLASRIDRPLPKSDRSRLESILARCGPHARRHAETEGQLIYAAFGSACSTNLAFLRKLMGVVEERPNWELVLSLSERMTPDTLGPIPERVHVFSWVPQLELLKHADVVVTHGGINTIDECVLHGVPMLMHCGFETDMGGNTARVVHHGIGLSARQRDRTADLRKHLDRLLREPDLRANVRRLRQKYEAYAEQHVAEQVVESLLAEGSMP